MHFLARNDAFWALIGPDLTHSARPVALAKKTKKRKNEGSKRVVPLKKVPFGGLNNVPLNFGGKIPQKLKFWGRE